MVTLTGMGQVAGAMGRRRSGIYCGWQSAEELQVERCCLQVLPFWGGLGVAARGMWRGDGCVESGRR